ncbi:MAG: RimK/LysX family protein [Methylococcales bacterium]|nr:RimK/LysX family protein [Methylococcales bacterium]
MSFNGLPRFMVLAGLWGLCASAQAVHVGEKRIAGWVEKVVLEEGQFILTAKLDTGARTSSIHAQDIGYFTRDGEDWVRFVLPVETKQGNKNQPIEAKLHRMVKIKRHTLPSAERPVIHLGFCLNDHYYVTQFTLADRSNYHYPVLLGRRFLKGRLLVDSATQFTQPKQVHSGACQPGIEN